MPSFKHIARIVVGVDGSAKSRDAVAWAVHHARGPGATVELVHVWHVPARIAETTKDTFPVSVPTTAAVRAAERDDREAELTAERMREQAIELAHERKSMHLLERVRDAALPDPHDRAKARLVSIKGDAGPALVRYTRETDLLVVSSHRASRIGVTALGSVSLYCTLHAACPVVVLPAARRSRRRLTRTQREVVHA